MGTGKNLITSLTLGEAASPSVLLLEAYSQS